MCPVIFYEGVESFWNLHIFHGLRYSYWFLGSLSCGLEVEQSSPSRPNVRVLQENGDENDVSKRFPNVKDHPLHRDYQPLERELLLRHQLLHRLWVGRMGVWGAFWSFELTIFLSKIINTCPACKYFFETVQVPLQGRPDLASQYVYCFHWSTQVGMEV